MKNYFLFFVALLASTSYVHIIGSDAQSSAPFSAMKASIYPLEKPGRGYKNVRPIVDRVVRQGRSTLLTDLGFTLKSGCFLSTKKEGDVYVVIAGMIENGVMQAAHIILCAELPKFSHGKNEPTIKQATVVATTYSGFGDEGSLYKNQNINLLTRVGQLLTKRGYNLSNDCSRLETEGVFKASGFGSFTHSPLFVYDKTNELFNPSYCQELTCSKIPCEEHNK